MNQATTTLTRAARYKAWGRIHKLDQDEIRQPFRFQGQYEDAETGLFYNRHRYYDPDTARYITQDPIGLQAGENLYQYAPTSTTWVDPLGLNKSCCTCPTLNRRQALNKAKDLAGIPRFQQAVAQWQVGGDPTRRGMKNYRYSDNPTHHGRFYEYIDADGARKVVVEHTNDPKPQGGAHAHAGRAKGDDPRNYDFKNNPYQKIDDPKTGDHHVYYGC